VNDKHSLQFVNAPGFSNNYADAMYQNKSYFLGTSVQRKTLTFKVACDRITLGEYREFLSWLNIYSIGFLQLDYEESYGYNVKLSALTESEKYPVYECNGEMVYMVVLSLTFETTDDFYAVHRYITTGLIEYNSTTSHYELTNSIFNLEGETEIQIRDETPTSGTEILYVGLSNYGTLDTSFNLAVQNMNGSLILDQAITDIRELTEDQIDQEYSYLGYIENNDFDPSYLIDLEYESNTGQCTSNGILAARAQAQGQLIFKTIDIDKNIIIPAQKMLILKLTIIQESNPSFMVQFQKRTQVI
jgi:hypothetical protein